MVPRPEDPVFFKGNIKGNVIYPINFYFATGKLMSLPMLPPPQGAERK